MNRRQKIIVSVTSIFLVLLILVGLTYAYFLTQITGNTNPKSISVTTANLQVKYEDGDNIILDENTKLVPSSTAIGTKTFDVVNEGDATDYVVIVDNISIKNATTGVTTTFKTNDFVYTLECVSSDGNDCSDVKTQTTLPLKNQSILVGNRMNGGVTHTYTLTLWYLDNGENQSDDMNKTLEARINIEDIRRLENPYKDNINSLAYNIINNSISGTNGTKLVAAPLTNPINKTGSEIEKTLSVTQDNYTSTYYNQSYYYRGSVEDNYLELNNMCWRIVRIEGDGSVKVTLAAQKKCSEITSEDTNSAIIGIGGYGQDFLYLGDLDGDGYEEGFSYGLNYETETENDSCLACVGGAVSTMKNAFNKFINGGSFLSMTPDIINTEYMYYNVEEKKYTSWSNTLKTKIKSQRICLGDTKTFYEQDGTFLNLTTYEDYYSARTIYLENYIRLVKNKNVSLLCSDKGLSKESYLVSSLNIDEVLLSGSFLYDNSNNFITISSSKAYESMGGVVFDSYMTESIIDITDMSFRPSLSLIPGIELSATSGNGTIDSPYKVVEN